MTQRAPDLSSRSNSSLHPNLVIAGLTRNPCCVWHCHNAWIPDQVRDDSQRGMTAIVRDDNIVLSLRAPTRNPCCAWHCHNAWIPDQVRDDSQRGMTASVRDDSQRGMTTIVRDDSQRGMTTMGQHDNSGVGISQISNNKRAGSSSASFIATRPSTASRPSMMRWS